MLRKFAARCIITILKHLQKYTLEHQAATIAGVCGEMLVESLISTEMAHKKQFEHIYTTTHDIEACFVYVHAACIWTNPSNANEYLHSMQTIVCSLQRLYFMLGAQGSISRTIIYQYKTTRITHCIVIAYQL